LGIKFERGLASIALEANSLGIGLSLKYVPDYAFEFVEKEKGTALFHPVGFPQYSVEAHSNEIAISLTDFRVLNSEEDSAHLGCNLRPGLSMETVLQGLLVRFTKDKTGNIHREVLTRHWSDWIDYWEIDFEYGKRQSLKETAKDSGTRVSRPGKPLFVSQWQSYRTRKKRKLKLTSPKRHYALSGLHEIAVKAIDIFGYETMEIIRTGV